MLIISSYFK